MKYVLAIDQGTTGTTSVLINSKDFSLIDKYSTEFPQIYPSPGWVEHNLDEIWNTVQITVSKLLENNKVDPLNIIAIGITNQRETLCAFDNVGNPLSNAIVWQDRRTALFCDYLKSLPSSNYIADKTGLTIDPYFSGSKINWLLNNNDLVAEHAKKDDLKFGTIDTYLLYKLSGGKSYFTEATNASRTLLMDLKNCCWDSKLLNIFGVQKKFLPQIKNSFDDFGVTHELDFLPNGIPITGILGDQQSALFGQAGLNSGEMKCTYGTGAFMLLNTGNEIIKSNSGLLSTVAYKTQDNTFYALEGSCYIAGAAVQWLRDNLEFFPESPEIEKMAMSVTNLDEMKHIIFLPFFTGVGSPYWNSNAKAAILGLTRDTNKNHIARACLEGIAFSVNDIISSMRKDLNSKISELKVDGGACANNLLMSMQSTISNLLIIRPKIIETTAYGAALAAAVGAQLLKIDQISKLWQEDSEFTSRPEWNNFYVEKSKRWNKTISSNII